MDTLRNLVNLRVVGAVLLLALLVNSAYLAAFNSATLFYMANVLLHVVLGVALLAAGVWLAWRWRSAWQRPSAMVAAALLALGAALGVFLVFHGNLQRDWLILWAHVAVASLGAAALWPLMGRWRNALAACLILLIALPAATALYRRAFPNPHDRIRNPLMAPLSMKEEGGGEASPFWPSGARTNVGTRIPANFFLDSAQCGECHKDAYRQWESSMHHFASFNNQFYRKSIEYMQAVQGSTKPSQWCAGCHDHAVIFSGKWAQPIKDQIDTVEAQAGLGCISCHAISHVDSSMGNAGFTMEYNALHDLAASRNRYVQAIDRFLTYANPGPHRRTFMKPFMRLDNSEYCSTCHKVHLDQPVNSYRWVRGFNDYDNWQASGVSGQGARSFYYPQKSSTCGDCHMPLVASQDPGNKGGFIHSHRFPGANTAVPLVNGDEAQLNATKGFLQSGFLTADIFAAAPVQDSGVAMRRRTQEGPQLNSTFATGEEAEQGGQVTLREVGQIAAPIDRAGTKYQAGSTVRVDVVVRTRKIGHFFPGGTVDSFDVWVELQGKDATGRIIFWSGQVEDEGRGPVEPGAHFYRSYQLDADGNPINKRNAWQTRSLLYVRLIPPGAADVAHYRVHIPPDAKGPITLQAKVNYRKFAHYFTQFSYAGEPEPGQDASLVSIHADNRRFGFSPANIPANVSGKIKGQIPVLPVVTVATAETVLPLADGTTVPQWQPAVRKEDRERWNDWGIGLLLQGDLKGAEYAFQKVTEADPKYPDGWINVARALIQEGETERAKQYLQKALALNPKLSRAWYFLALTQKTDGDYDGALVSLRKVTDDYPRDRVVLNQMGRILFLKKEYAEAVKSFAQVISVDPEDVQAHYNLMLCYRGLGQAEAAAREEKLFRRYKADESSQTITGKARLASAEANNERQAIHDHESVRLAGTRREERTPRAGSMAGQP